MSAAFILAMGFSVSAQKQNPKFYSLENNQYSLPFSKIVIEDDIDVVLHESTDKSILVEGSEENISNVEWKIKKGVMHVSSKAGSLKDKVLVTLDVKDLKQIEVNGNSEVKSLGNLHSSLLHIYLNGYCLVNILNEGKITLVNGDGIGLDIKKKTANVALL